MSLDFTVTVKLLHGVAEDQEQIERIHAAIWRGVQDGVLVSSIAIADPTPSVDLDTVDYQARLLAEKRPCGPHPCDVEYPGRPSKWCSACLVGTLVRWVDKFREEATKHEEALRRERSGEAEHDRRMQARLSQMGRAE
jgi:hypothetical protein